MMDFSARDEIFFISYHDVIKAPVINIMDAVLIQYRKQYENFIEMSLFNELKTGDELLTLLTHRPHYNIFRCFCNKEFDYDKAWSDIYHRNYKLIAECNPITIGTSLFIMLKQSFIPKVYVWTEEYDERIHHDLYATYGSGKLAYVTGDFLECVNGLDNITCYILNDIEYLMRLLEVKEKLKLTNVLLGDYGYNYPINEEFGGRRDLKIENLYKVEEENCFKLNLFKPLKK